MTGLFLKYNHSLAHQQDFFSMLSKIRFFDDQNVQRFPSSASEAGSMAPEV
jgi:hypothetical protein